MAKTIEITVNRNSPRYSVEIEEGALLKIASTLKSRLHLKDNLPKIFLVTHLHLNTLYGQRVIKALEEGGFKVFVENISVGETIKTWSSAEKLLQKMIDLKLGRNTIVMALGGGVVGDLAGFVAAVYKRGVRFIQIPTTLLAMVDSSVGGKVAVNLGVAGKNLVGAFHQPCLVITDLHVLKTLPEQEWKHGMSEVLKCSLIKEDNGTFYRWLSENRAALLSKSSYPLIEHMISECVRTKALIVSRDETEKNDARILLNLGHTFGHSLEAASRYRIAHGEAVAMGLGLASRLAVKLNKISPTTAEQIINLIKSYNLPHCIDKKLGFNTADLIRHFEYDKKTEDDMVRFIVPSGTLGHSEVVQNVPPEILEQVFAESIS